MTPEDFQKLSEEQRADIKEKIYAIQADFDTTEREMNRINQELRARLEEPDREGHPVSGQKSHGYVAGRI